MPNFQEPEKTQNFQAPAKKGRGPYFADQFLGSLGLGPKVDPRAYGKTGVPAMARVQSRIEGNLPLVDEAIDYGKSLATGKSYKDVRKAREAFDTEGANRYPILNAFGNLAGAAIDAGLGARVFGALPESKAKTFVGEMAQPRVAQTGEGLLSGTLRRGLNLGRNATIGAAGGVGAGLLGQGSLGERVEDAKSLALPGALAGMVLPTAMNTTNKVWNAGERAFAPKAAKSQAKAGRVLKTIVPNATEPLPVKSAAELPFERMGPGAKTVARALTATPGKGQDIALEAFKGRRAGATQRMTEATKAATGATGEDFYPVLRTTEAMRRAEADPLYEAAKETPINAVDYEREMGPLLSSKWGQQAFTKARDLALAREALTGEPQGFPQNIINPETGGVQGVEVPNAKTLGYISQAWDDLLQPYRDPHGNLVNLDNQGRMIRDMREEFVKRLGKLVPEDQLAREAYRGSSRTLDAMKYGREATGANWDPELIYERNQQATPEEIDAQRVGVARGISDKLLGPNPRAFYRAMRDNPMAMARLRAAFGPENDPAAEQAFRQFQQAAEQEAGYEQSFADIAQGSRTTPLAQDIRSVNEAAEEPGAMGKVADVISRKLNGEGFIRQGARGLVNTATRKASALDDPVVSELLGEVLFKGRDPNEVLAMAVQQQRITPEMMRRLTPIYAAIAGMSQQRQEPQPQGY